MKRPRLLPDNMTLLLLGVILIASFFPCDGKTAIGLATWVVTVLVAYAAECGDVAW